MSCVLQHTSTSRIERHCLARHITTQDTNGCVLLCLHLKITLATSRHKTLARHCLARHITTQDTPEVKTQQDTSEDQGLQDTRHLQVSCKCLASVWCLAVSCNTASVSCVSMCLASVLLLDVSCNTQCDLQDNVLCFASVLCRDVSCSTVSCKRPEYCYIFLDEF